MIHPSENISLKDILRLKAEGKINNTCLLHMKFICNVKSAALCLLFLLGGHCDYTDPCGYHLQVHDLDHLLGTSNDNYKPFHDCMEANKCHVYLITAASKNANLYPS